METLIIPESLLTTCKKKYFKDKNPENILCFDFKEKENQNFIPEMINAKLFIGSDSKCLVWDFCPQHWPKMYSNLKSLEITFDITKTIPIIFVDFSLLKDKIKIENLIINVKNASMFSLELKPIITTQIEYIKKGIKQKYFRKIIKTGEEKRYVPKEIANNNVNIKKIIVNSRCKWNYVNLINNSNVEKLYLNFPTYYAYDGDKDLPGYKKLDIHSALLIEKCKNLKKINFQNLKIQAYRFFEYDQSYLPYEKDQEHYQIPGPIAIKEAPQLSICAKHAKIYNIRLDYDIQKFSNILHYNKQTLEIYKDGIWNINSDDFNDKLKKWAIKGFDPLPLKLKNLTDLDG